MKVIYSKGITVQVEPGDLEQLDFDEEKADLFTVVSENPCECCLYDEIEPRIANWPCEYCERQLLEEKEV